MEEVKNDDNFKIVDRRDGKEGKTFGVYDIKPESGVDRWEIIRRMIEDFAVTHPNDMKEILDAVKEKRKEGNDYGSAQGDMKSLGFRRGMMLPAGLHILLKNNFPELFKDKKLYNQMMKKFPGFVTINKI